MHPDNSRGDYNINVDNTVVQNYVVQSADNLLQRKRTCLIYFCTKLSRSLGSQLLFFCSCCGFSSTNYWCLQLEADNVRVKYRGKEDRMQLTGIAHDFRCTTHKET